MSLDESSPFQDGPPAVHSVHEFVFSVPDLIVAERFYTSFGLEVRHEEGGLGLYTFGNAHRWGKIVPGDHKRLLWVSLGIYEDDVHAFERRFQALKINPITPPPQAGTDGIWISGPDGLPLQLVVAEKCSPRIKSLRIFPPEVSDCGRAPSRSAVEQVKPNRLSHILLFVSDVRASMQFYTTVLGFRLSDHSGAIVAFLHSPHGSDHHLLAMAKSDGYGLHHTSWDVSSIDAVALGGEQMARAGHERGWGLGRHVLGSNYFRYVRDPWGSYAEYSFDIDYIPAGMEWPAADHPPADSLYVWGPSVPEDFVVNYELL